ncbi:MAG: PIN domain-containing protein [Sulfuricella sp.]|nr:PIN domain-containing protein [Sulfuricella sp.]
MKVIVDTSVWSLALRRDSQGESAGIVAELEKLIQDYRVVMLGPIRQELLSGIRHAVQFERLRDRLQVFPDLRLAEADFETAAQFFNQCRAKGIQGSNTDFLICAAAVRRNMAIFTTDKDFALFGGHLDIRLHEVR